MVRSPNAADEGTTDSPNEAEAHDPLRIWQQLPPELAERIIALLPQNEVACTIRLVNRAAAAQFRAKRHTTVVLSRPVPHHAFVHRWDRPDAARSLPLKQRRLLLRLTARSGCIPNLEVLIQRLDCPFTTSLLAAAATSECCDVCDWLVGRGCCWSESVMRAAAATGNVTFCEWLLAAGCPFDDRALAAAAAAGHAAVVRMLASRGASWGTGVPCAAAEGGHVELLDWLLTVRPPTPGSSAESILTAVASGCDLATLQRLHSLLVPGTGALGGDADAPAAVLSYPREHLRIRHVTAAICSRTPDWRAKAEWLLAAHGYPLAVDCWQAAAGRPDWLERLQWLEDMGLRPDIRAAVAASRAGRADALAFLLSRGVRLAGYEAVLVREAARHGHLEVLRTLREAGVRVDVDIAVLQAAARGHVAVVQWLLETYAAAGGGEAAGEAGGAGGIPGAGEAGGGGGGSAAGGGDGVARLEEEAANGAAGAGSLELLTWLHARGCRFREQTFAIASEWGSQEMVEWLVEHGCPMGEAGEPYVCAGRAGDLATLRCLRRLRCPWDPSGATFTRAVAQGCSLRVLQWLHEEGCPVNWTAAWREARRPWRKDAEALEWVDRQRRAAGLLASGCSWLRAVRPVAWCGVGGGGGGTPCAAATGAVGRGGRSAGMSCAERRAWVEVWGTGAGVTKGVQGGGVASRMLRRLR